MNHQTWLFWVLYSRYPPASASQVPPESYHFQVTEQCTFNPSTQEEEAGGSLFQASLGCLVRPWLKTKPVPSMTSCVRKSAKSGT